MARRTRTSVIDLPRKPPAAASDGDLAPLARSVARCVSLGSPVASTRRHHLDVADTRHGCRLAPLMTLFLSAGDSLLRLQISPIVAILKCVLMRHGGGGSELPIMDGAPATSVTQPPCYSTTQPAALKVPDCTKFSVLPVNSANVA